MERDTTAELTERVRSAAGTRTALAICGSGSKGFYGRAQRGEPLVLTAHAGVIDYDPQELVLTARTGTRLRDLETLLAEAGQYLPFEPPHFGPAATLGGTIACGLAGPARASAGPVRDFVLGARVLTGAAEVLSFGGRVMKNVAGYDVTRLMVGACGTLGVLLEVSLKVLPRAAQQLTLMYDFDAAQATARMNDWAMTALPISATTWVAGQLYARLHGSEAALVEARRRMGGEELPQAQSFWYSIKEQTHLFFDDTQPLWRMSVPAETAPLEAPGRTLIEWTGAQRWVVPADETADLHAVAARVGGFATRFRARHDGAEVFAPLPAALMQVHRELKKTFDPQAILNPGRLYADL
ncbi:MAG TPA: glycolate oxidase subunit GlcE [Steroidobacteraceae bacterium]